MASEEGDGYAKIWQKNSSFVKMLLSSLEVVLCEKELMRKLRDGNTFAECDLVNTEIM